MVPGPPPATLTEVASELAAVLPPGYVVAPVDRATPAAVTRIDYEQIWSSGARNLNELFDIFVPNAQVIRHHAQPPHLGIRGIISDKDDKYLLRVNGRVMNNRSQLGSLSEHCLPMLGDIHHIDFIRGPGSTTYGPGAISGVVNIVTYNGLTFQGTDATVRQGFLENFTSVEVRHGVKLSDDSGLFLYYGYADYPGAPQEYSPYVFGRSFTALEGVPVVAGEPVTFDVPNDHRTYRSSGRHKVHAQYTKGNFDAWLRYTRSGEQEVFRRDFVTSPPLGTVPAGTSFDDLSTEEVGLSAAHGVSGLPPGTDRVPEHRLGTQLRHVRSGAAHEGGPVGVHRPPRRRMVRADPGQMGPLRAALAGLWLRVLPRGFRAGQPRLSLSARLHAPPAEQHAALGNRHVFAAGRVPMEDHRPVDRFPERPGRQAHVHRLADLTAGRDRLDAHRAGYAQVHRRQSGPAGRR